MQDLSAGHYEGWDVGYFSSCTNLKTVVFGDGVNITKISNYTFANCPSLESITFSQETAPEVVNAILIPTSTKIYVKSQTAKTAFEKVFTNNIVEVL